MPHPINASERQLAAAPEAALSLHPADPPIRAAFLRALLADGAPGLRISGARISGRLDLEGLRVAGWLDLGGCVFEQAPLMRGAQMDGLALDGARLPGLRASRLSLRDDLRLRGAALNGELRLRRARIGGDLMAMQAVLRHPGATALDGDGMRLGGSAFLSGAALSGTARLIDSRLERHLACIGTRFGGAGGKALRLSGARIGGVFFLRRGARLEGELDLTGARIGALSDEADCWPARGALRLNRCIYGGFTGGPADAAARLDWLDRMSALAPGRGFQPQPYIQLAETLRAMGHEADARAVLIARERRQRATARAELGARIAAARAASEAAPDAQRALAARAPLPELRLSLMLARACDAALDTVIGFGHRPARALIFALGVWIGGAGLFHWTHRHDGMKPNDTRVTCGAEWTGCLDAPDRMACYHATAEGISYPRFQPLAYALDALAPMVDLGQDSAWRPAAETGPGWWARLYLWGHALAGWALTLLAASGFAGLVKKGG